MFNQKDGNNERNRRDDDAMTALAPDFVPGPFDVVCGRGKIRYNHSGNRRYRVLVEMHIKKYVEAKTKMEKSVIVSSIAEAIQEASPQGGFVKQMDGSARWYRVGEYTAREKIGQSLRIKMQEQLRSKTQAPKADSEEKNKILVNGPKQNKGNEVDKSTATQQIEPECLQSSAYFTTEQSSTLNTTPNKQEEREKEERLILSQIQLRQQREYTEDKKPAAKHTYHKKDRS